MSRRDATSAKCCLAISGLNQWTREGYGAVDNCTVCGLCVAGSGDRGRFVGVG